MTQGHDDFNFRIDLRGLPSWESANDPPRVVLITRKEAVAMTHAHDLTWYCRAVGYPLAGGCGDALVLPSSFMEDREINRINRRAQGVATWFESFDAASSRGLPRTLAEDEATKTAGAVHPSRAEVIPAHAAEPPIIDPGKSPSLWSRTRAWVTRIMGTPPVLGHDPRVPWCWLIAPESWTPPDDSKTFDALPPVLSPQEIRDLPTEKVKSLRRRREGLASVEAAYLTLRELGYQVEDLRGRVFTDDASVHIANAEAYGKSYALRSRARWWSGGRQGDLPLRGLATYARHVAASLAVKTARRAQEDVGSGTPDMQVLAVVGERMARGRGEEIVAAVAAVPVRVRTGPYRGRSVPLAEALHSGEWFYVSDELFRANLDGWLAQSGHTLAADPWRCTITRKADGTWTRPLSNMRTVIQSMYGVGSPRSKKARDGERTYTVWRFDPAQIRQRLRDCGRDVPVDFAPPEELIDLIVQDDPWRKPIPEYVPALRDWLGDAQNLKADDPEFADRKRALERIAADSPVAVDAERMKQIIAELPQEKRGTPRSALRAGKDAWTPKYVYASNGRLMSTKPNIQGIPAACREAITIPEGRVVVDVDLVSAHANIAALVTGDEVLEEELQTSDVYQKLADVVGAERADAKIRFLAWLNGSMDDVVEGYIGARYPNLYAHVSAVDRSSADCRRLLASTWTEVEGRILTHVLARLPAGLRLIAPMHDGLVYHRPADRTDLDQQVAELWKDGAQAATGSDYRWKAKVTVADRWR